MSGNLPARDEPVKRHVSKTEMFQPKSLAELQSIAEVVAKSNFIPSRYAGKPGDIIVAGMTGSELGFGLMQSLQAIYVVRGTPGMYVEHMIGMVRASGKCQYLHATIDRKTMIATCRTKRTDEQGEHVYTFSAADATKAGYYVKREGAKDGAWQERDWWMLQVRSIGNALKHVYPDVTKGMQIAELAREYDETHPRLVEAEVMPRAIGEKAPEVTPTVIPEADLPPADPTAFADPNAPPAPVDPPAPDDVAQAPAQPAPLGPTPDSAKQPRENGKAPAAPAGKLEIPPGWSEGQMAPISEAQAKRMYAIAMNSGYTKDTLKALIGKWGYSHSDEILRGHYDDIMNTIKPGSNKPREA